MNQTSLFCTGNGRVMLPGFQVTAYGGPCILFLFGGVNMNTPVLYFLGIFFSILMGVFNEALSFLRNRISFWIKDKSDFFKIIITILYGIQMINAYWMMLLVMTYELLIFIALIVGLMLGNFIFSLKILKSTSQKEYETINEGLNGGTTPCCDGNQTKTF
jgi:hypothetical protein